MKIVFSPTFAEFKQAVRLDRKVNFSNRMFHFVMTWLAPVIAIFAILLLVVVAMLFVVHFESRSLVTFAALGVCLLGPVFENRAMRRSFKAMFPGRDAENEVAINFDEGGIDAEIPGIAATRYPWGAFTKFVQNDDAVLLYVSTKRFLFIPARAFTPAQRAELDDLVARHLAQGKP